MTFECDHQPRRIAWPGGEAMLTANGNWVMDRRTKAGSLEVVRLDHCPGCGVELWNPLPVVPTGVEA